MMVKRVRICTRGICLDLLLVITLLFLCVTFYNQYRKAHPDRRAISRQDIESNENGYPEVNAPRSMRKVEELLRMEKTEGLRDVRSQDCQGRSYSRGVDLVALVIHFFDYEFYDVRNTLASCARGESDVIGEIVVVDDGSTLNHISAEAAKYFANMKPVAKFIRSNSHEGASKARSLGLSKVSLDLVVFLDASVICSPGWLKPLIDVLTKHADHSHLFVLPHHDRILHPVSLEYEPISQRTRAAMSWGLGVRMLPSPDRVEEDGLYRSTVMRGNIFATTKTFLEKIGSFDSELDEGGGEALELSLRGWICGARILTNPCSRVGIINLSHKITISSVVNLQRIANMWFGSGSTPVLTLAGSADLARPLSQAKSQSIKDRLEHLHSTLQCKDINWFLKEVAGLTTFPSSDVLKFGMLRAGSDAYARVGSESKVELVNKPESGAPKLPNFIFELTRAGALTSAGRCATALKSSHVLFEQCRPTDKQQKWIYRDALLVNAWTGLCATHVTDPDENNRGRQVIMVQACLAEKQDQEKFKRWTFVEI